MKCITYVRANDPVPVYGTGTRSADSNAHMGRPLSDDVFVHGISNYSVGVYGPV